MKKTIIMGGGTISHIRNHLALAAPAYGTTARRLAELCKEHSDKLEVKLYLTKMAGSTEHIMESVENVAEAVDNIIKDPAVKIFFFNVAMVDFYACLDGTKNGKYEPRLQSRVREIPINLRPYGKVINRIRRERKDIYLVGFKTTCNASPQEQYLAGLKLVKEGSCNLVLANDTVTRWNMVITPEEAAYHETHNREDALRALVEMAYLRSHLTFTRSTVIAGESVPWDSQEVPTTLRLIVNHCIDRGAYKAFNGSTVGHFAVKTGPHTFLTSKRKTNFNELKDIGLVRIETDGPDTVLAYGSKPSVGGQSQRIVFAEHPDSDCIVHFHCPLKAKPRDLIPIVSQREYECGSHQCGQNTSSGLKKFTEGRHSWHAVYLDKHGPNIVFNHGTSHAAIIGFIEANFDLSGKTGGYLV